jgi:hypothetical protein
MAVLDFDSWYEDALARSDNGSRPPWLRSPEAARRVYDADAQALAAHEAKLAANGATQTKVSEASEIALLRGECQALRRRVKALEDLTSLKGALSAGIGMALAEICKDIDKKIGEIRKEFEALIAERDQKLADLERHRLKWMGVFEHGAVYSEGAMVTKGGSLWYCTKETRQAPGVDNTDWCLAVKKDMPSRGPSS